MPYYEVIVEETRHYTMRYLVDADDQRCAAIAAEDGISERETLLKEHGVVNRTVSLDDIKQVPVFIAVEYDLKYYGGDYHGYGETALLPFEGLTDDNLHERFRQQTGHDPVHIVHYTFDEPVDADGESLEG